MRRMFPGRTQVRPASSRAGLGVALFALLGGVAVSTPAQDAGDRCEHLPQDQRPLCEALADCSSRPDAAARKACFDAAYEELRRAEAVRGTEAIAPDAKADEPPVTATNEPLEPLVEQRLDETPKAQSAVRTTQAEPPGGKRDRKWFRWLRRSRTVDPKPAPAALPKRFDANVQAVWPRVQGWQLLLLDNGLLLEGRRGPESRIRVGDAVKVQVAKTLGGEQYRVTAPSRRTFQMVRLRCDEKSEHARKCAAARRQNPKAGW